VPTLANAPKLVAPPVPPVFPLVSLTETAAPPVPPVPMVTATVPVRIEAGRTAK
jgi:hypothetical protein